MQLRKEVVRLETRLQKMVKMSEHLCSMAEVRPALYTSAGTCRLWVHLAPLLCRNKNHS